MRVDTSVCTVSSNVIPHEGEVALSEYRDKNGSAFVQILCSAHRGEHWTVIGAQDKPFKPRSKKKVKEDRETRKRKALK